MKRWRTPRAKSGELRVVYGKSAGDGPDIYYCHGGKGASKPDGMMLSYFFETVLGLHGRTLRDELIHRGYDITTFKFSIQQKAMTPTTHTESDKG